MIPQMIPRVDSSNFSTVALEADLSSVLKSPPLHEMKEPFIYISRRNGQQTGRTNDTTISWGGTSAVCRMFFYVIIAADCRGQGN
jgi:hypothetical protein